MIFTMRSAVVLGLGILVISQAAPAAPIVANNSQWRYLKGTSEASAPVTAWRTAGFSDSSWSVGPAAFYYGETLTGTLLSDMNGAYSSIYLRHTFSVTDPAQIGGLTLTGTSDDGFIAWINGVEVARYNMPAGQIAYNGAASTALEPVTTTYTITNQGGLLTAGNNVLAVHAFNSALSGSSDFAFYASLDSLLTETVAPTIIAFSPAAGQRTNLNQINVTFSEEVTGVEAGDLLINGVGAATVFGGGSNYTFSFPPPTHGPVQISWNDFHGIRDLSFDPNFFDHTEPAANWQYEFIDVVPPVVSSLSPSSGSILAELSRIDVVFTEGVLNVDAGDLLINGSGASNVVQISPSYYVFQFAPQPTGDVSVAWIGSHGIVDLAQPANSFAGGAWSYRVDPAAATTRVIISEFMAANSSGLKDEDNDPSDWIEIFNAGNSSVNLLNWSLTDDADELDMWQFPSTNIAPGQFLVVFASEKNRRESGGELHTNFRLSNSGEYLALADPSGNVVSEFNFGRQIRDVSYGFGSEVSNFGFIGTGTVARVHIPADGVLAQTWTAPEFSDALWLQGTNGVGYDTGLADPGENAYGPAVLATSPMAYFRFVETSGTIGTNSGTAGSSLNGTFQAGVTLGQAGPRPPTQAGFEPLNTSARFNGTSQYMSTTSQLLSGRNAFTIAGWINPAATPGNRVGLFGQNDAVEFGFISGTTMQVWTPSGGSLNVTYTYPMGTWHHVVAVGDGQTLRIFLDGTLAGTGGSPTASYGSSTFNFNIGGGGIFDTSTNFFNGHIDEVLVYQRALSASEISLLYTAGITAPNASFTDLIKTDVRTAMKDINSTAYIRIPFQVSSPLLIDRVTLQMRYDDGFLAYLNGQLVASGNALESNAWNSAATEQHTDVAARVFQQFELPDAASLLTSGENILAIHGLNFARTNNDFFIQAELDGVSIGELGTVARFFTAPTPGAPNGIGVSDLGPIIFDTAHSPAVPSDSQDLVVTAQVSPSFSPVSAVSLNYRVMYGPLNTLAMLDDGAHGDGAAGDQIYGAVIPANLSTNGQMIRWTITASDTEAHTSRWPLYNNPPDSEEYLGTIVSDPSIESRLPVLHMFIESPAAADTDAGTFCSLFYLGEFYDHVEINIHGQSSRGFPKKSYDLDFPNDHRFLYKEDGERVKDIKMLQNWGDKAKMRTALGYEFIKAAGSDGHFAFQVRVQQNSRFYSVYDLVEDPDDLWMERLGRDPNGALYKIYNNLSSASGAEKKTRRQEGSADLAALVSSLDPALTLSNRAVYAFDNIDLPQSISYMTVCALISHQDHGHKNLYVYRDSDGNGEWALIPWDIDLSWGRNWVDNPGYFTDTMYVDNELDFYNPAQQNKGANRFYDLLTLHPDFRAMYLRRLRTIMDTILKAPGTPASEMPIENRIREMIDLIDPPDIGTSDADRDFARWASWGNNNQARPEANRIINEHLVGRRNFLYNSVNAALNGERIPSAQPANVVVQILDVESNPASGNQDQEYMSLTNINAFAVDISNWRIDGGIQHTFRPGTVMPGYSKLFVSPDVNAFRARTTGPRRGLGLYVQGPYTGRLSARGETVALIDAGGRRVSSRTYPGTPSVAQDNLRVTEIMYNPSALQGNTNDPQAFEYIELKNISATTAVPLSGIHFSNGIDFKFTGSPASLAPGARIVLVKNAAAFTARYGGSALVAGEFTGSLNNGGERVQLFDAVGEEILDFTYNNQWYPITDGLGFSLVVADELAAPDAWNNKSQWRASGQADGSPGAIDPGPANLLPVLINEVLSRSENPPPTDSIELYNPNSTDAPVGSWYLTDDFTEPRKYQITAETMVPANGYLVFDESHFNAGGGGFALSSDNDEVYLFAADANGVLSGYYHGFSFGASATGVTFGRHRISTGDEHFVAQQDQTLGVTNSPPRVGPVVISEIMYRPEALGEDNSLDEFIELVNITASPVALFDPLVLALTWELTDAVDYVFPTDVTLAAGERVLLVGFDPATNATALASFRQKYGVAVETRIFGPYAGGLNNASDSVELKKPTQLPGGITALVLVDKVEYDDHAPWPAGADGFGLSLQRRNETAYGNDPANWNAAPVSAGLASASGGTAPTITSLSPDKQVIAGADVSFTVSASGSATLRYQWRFEGENISGATNQALQLDDVDLSDLGGYDVLVYNAYGSALSAVVALDVLLPASITAQPEPVATAPGANVSFSVSVFSDNPLTYQWRKNGFNIPGATGSSLQLANVQPVDDALYDVVVTTSVGSIVSDSVRLTILVSPTIVVQPVNQTNVLGGSVTFSVEVTNTATLPLYYRWARGSTIIVPYRPLYTRTDFFTVTNIQAGDSNGNYLVRITNAANFAPGVQSVSNVRLYLVTETDTDGDGIPDAYEDANNLNKGSAADATLDADGDGISNRDEYRSGTNPQDANSVLRVDTITAGGGARIRFQAIANRSYALQYQNALGDGDWHTLFGVPAVSSGATTNRPVEVVDPEAATQGERIYRLVTPGVSSP